MFTRITNLFENDSYSLQKKNQKPELKSEINVGVH